MKKILLFTTVIIIIVFVFLHFSEKRNGYLNKDINMDSVTVYFGTETIGGRVHLWTDKTNGELYSDPEKTLQNGFTSDPHTLRYTGKNANNMYETVVNLKVTDSYISETLPDSLKEYEKKYYEQCSTCHAAAALNRFNKSRWENILKSMQQHSGISDEDLTAIRRYILLSITN